MDEDVREDSQRARPAAWCRWCGRELYPGEEAWRLLGATLHEGCVGAFARAECDRQVLTEKGWEQWT